MSGSRKWLTGVAVVVVVLGMGFALPSLAPRVVYAFQSAQAGVAAQRLEGTPDLSTPFEQVAEVIKPSVVTISSVKKIEVSQGTQRLPEQFFNAPFREFFGDEFYDQFFHSQNPGRGLVQQGLGTGVIISADGYVLTNNHVVRDADEVTVKLSDDRSFTAKVVGTDPKTDLAVLKVDASGLHPANLGDSDKLKVGEWVVASGNPFGLSATITAGIVSAKGRANMGLADYEDFIQTDAAINPGNSGGPLLNLRGEVVGINTAIFTKSGGYMGVGFAIPINMAKSIKDALITGGRVVRGWLGVAIQNLNEGLAKSFGYDSTEGVLIGDVTPEGPAAKAGLKAGDIIVRFDGQKAENMQKLRERVAELKPGTKVSVEVLREGKKETFNVEIGELKSETAAAGNQPSPVELGLTVRTLTPEIAQQLNYDTDLHGVVVTNVEPLSPVDRAGIQVRDVITSVADESVRDVEDFQHLLKKHDLKAGVRLTVQSGTTQRFVFIKTEK